MHYQITYQITHRRIFILLDGSRKMHSQHFHRNMCTQIAERLHSQINSLNRLLRFSQQLLLTSIHQHQFYMQIKIFRVSSNIIFCLVIKSSKFYVFIDFHSYASISNKGISYQNSSIIFLLPYRGNKLKNFPFLHIESLYLKCT